MQSSRRTFRLLKKTDHIWLESIPQPFLSDRLLERFENMNADEVKKIGFEIAVLGREGLDYASADKKYQLRSIPGESFSGLQLMCLMYVAFQKIDPALNTGIELKAAYEQALTLYQPR
jgi:hypothetical protein